MYACQYLIVRTFLQHAQNMHCGQYRCYLLNSFFSKTIIFFQFTKSAILFFALSEARLWALFGLTSGKLVSIRHIIQISPNLFVTHKRYAFLARNFFLSWTQKIEKLTSKMHCLYLFNCNLFKWPFFSSSTYFEVKKINCSFFLKLFQLQRNHLNGMVFDKIDY